MLYPNHKIENIFKLVHKTQDPKDIQWVIDNLGKFNYSPKNSYRDEDEFNFYYYDCSYSNLINFIIAKTVATEEQKDYLHLLRKAETFISRNDYGVTNLLPNTFYFLNCLQLSKKSSFDYLKNPFEEPS
jgi:hypothetical protein